MQIDKLTPNNAILTELGERLARVRKRQGQSQEALAGEAGLGVATLRRIEDGGDGKLGSWLKILKALDLEAGIEALLPAIFQSPMEEALANKKRSGGGRKPSGPKFVWGDEQS